MPEPSDRDAWHARFADTRAHLDALRGTIDAQLAANRAALARLAPWPAGAPPDENPPMAGAVRQPVLSPTRPRTPDPVQMPEPVVSNNSIDSSEHLGTACLRERP